LADLRLHAQAANKQSERAESAFRYANMPEWSAAHVTHCGTGMAGHGFLPMPQ
jgi:hypothetical protein